MLTEYINREAVMQMFADRVKRSNNSDFAPTPTWSQAVQIVEDFPAADVVERPRWISVKERLPEEKRDGFSDDVLMLVENPDGDITWKDVYVGYYFYDATSAETGWWAMMTCNCVKIGEHKYGSKVFPANEYVTHWMPLPEPPED